MPSLMVFGAEFMTGRSAYRGASLSRIA